MGRRYVLQWYCSVISARAKCHQLHLISSDMVINKQPGGIEVQEEVAPITGLILSQLKLNADISEISQVWYTLLLFQRLYRQYCICTSFAGRACHLDKGENQKFLKAYDFLWVSILSWETSFILAEFLIGAARVNIYTNPSRMLDFKIRSLLHEWMIFLQQRYHSRWKYRPIWSLALSNSST